MSVELQPSETLIFKRPLTRTSKEVLFIGNPTDQDVAFKVKTTAPKLYCVRPNAGFIKAHETQEVQIMLQPFKEEPSLDENCRDKFLVQTVYLDADIESADLATLWSRVELSDKKKNMVQHKLRCVYVGGEEEKKIVEVAPVEQKKEPKKPEVASVVSEPIPPQVVEPVIEMDKLDEVTKMRAQLDAYKSEMESLQSRAPGGVSWPLVIVVALLSSLVSVVLFKLVG